MSPWRARWRAKGCAWLVGADHLDELVIEAEHRIVDAELVLIVSAFFVDAVKFRCIPVTPIYVDGDLIRLVQSVGNLLHNAATYTPEGGAMNPSRVSGVRLSKLRHHG